MSTIWAFDHAEIKYSLYCREDFIERFCEPLSEYTKNIIDFEKAIMLPLTKKLRSHEDAMECYIFRKRTHKNLFKR